MNQSLQKVETNFGALLSQIDQGFFEKEVQDNLRELMAAITDTQKKGTITLTITIAPKPKFRAMGVTGDVKIGKPKHPAIETLFFPTPDGNLTRHDPRQIHMFDNQPTPNTTEVTTHA